MLVLDTPVMAMTSQLLTKRVMNADSTLWSASGYFIFVGAIHKVRWPSLLMAVTNWALEGWKTLREGRGLVGCHLVVLAVAHRYVNFK
jgi:hypothetical protein